MKINDLDIKEMREKLGYTQYKFATAIGVTVHTVQNWEAGRNIPLSKKLLIASVFGKKLNISDEKDNNKTLNIKEIREKLNLSQVKFAEKLGVTYQTVQNWEHGCNIPTAKRIMIETLLKGNFNNSVMIGGDNSGVVNYNNVETEIVRLTAENKILREQNDKLFELLKQNK